MANVTGLTAERMLQIEDASVVSGEINGDGHLILTTHGGDEIDAGGALVAVPAASTVIAGVVELATSAETAALTDTVRAVTPGSLAVVFSGVDSRLTAVESTTTNHESRLDTLEAVTPQSVGFTGEVRLWAGGSAPAGWELCEGQALSRTTYAALFTVIGTTYGAGNGTTTFNVPNLKGKIPVGQDTSQTEFDTVGETGGAKTHTLSVAELPSHHHTATSGGYALGGGTPVAYSLQGGATYGFGFNNDTGNTGSGTAHNNLQPYLVMKYIIKT